MLVAAVVLAVVVVVVGASAGSVLLAAGRAQDAADAAALAAAHARARAVAPVAAARSAAAAHGAVIDTCDCAGPVVSVTVRVPVTAQPARALGITTRRATAAARLLPLGAADDRSATPAP